MNDTSGRYSIYINDVARLANVQYRAARRILKKIRMHYNKPPRSLVSITEFCDFMQLREDEVRRVLGV